MSADNILIILEHEGKVRVHDVNFSDISSHDLWYSPLTPEQTAGLTKYVLDSQYHDVHQCDTVDQAIGFCNRYMRSNVVEYDYTCLIKVDEERKQVDRKKVREQKKNKAKLRQIRLSSR